MRELEMACAQVFRKKGKSRMPEKDFVFAISLDFKWLTPKEAQRLLEMCLEAGVLALEDGMVVPMFDHKGIDVPRGYKPTAELLQMKVAPPAPEPPKGLMMEVVEMVSRERGMETKDVISMVNRTQDGMGVDIEVAALVVARGLGLDVSGFLDRVEEGLGEKCRK
jgi:hypothetical protein